ncbi:MAG: hypothetical protein QOI78_1021 [Actinomycetota bacterium]|jgi:hypothetical protein|nr:hypothetical protein [Actinomycetota bacterium]
MGQDRRTTTGRVGARFPSAGRHALHTAPEDADDRIALPQPSSSVGRVGARFPSSTAAERLVPEPGPAPPPKRVPEPVADVVDVADVEIDEDFAARIIPAQDHGYGPRTLVRPYVLTRGRTQSRRHLAIEAMVSTRAGAHWNGARLTGEFRSVRTLCHHPRSVAEVAARLSVPLGVARVLLDDMAEQGLVTIHDTRVSADGRPAAALMERVLHGLRRL